MKNIKGEISVLWMLMTIWLLSMLLSAVMFTIGLMVDVIESIFISGLTGVLSLIGVFYTGGLLIKLKTRINMINDKTNI